MRQQVLALVLIVMLLGAPLASTIVATEPQAQPAVLAVEQPDYAEGSVEERRQNGTRLYVATHDELIIQPQNFAGEGLGFGTSEAEADLIYDDDFGIYRFDSQGTNGTFEVYWEVGEQRTVGDSENNTTVTQTVVTRYSARIRVTRAAEYTHLPTSEFEATEAAASNWEEWVSSLETLFGDDFDAETRTQEAFGYLKLRHEPLEALAGGYVETWMILLLGLIGVGSIGAGLVLLTFVLLHFGVRWSDLKYIYKHEALKGERREMEDLHSELSLKERLRKFARADWNDLWGDFISRAYREIEETPMRAALRLTQVRDYHNQLSFRLQAMSQCGYIGIRPEHEDDSAITDGGDTQPAAIGREEDVPDGVETVDLDEPPADFIDDLPPDDRLLRDFYLPDADIEVEDIDVEVDPLDLERLMHRLNTRQRDFDSVDEWARYLLEFVEFVREHPVTDDHGSPDEIQMVLNEWLDTVDQIADAWDLPQFKLEADMLEFAIDERSDIKQAEKTVEIIQEGGDASDLHSAGD